MVKRELPGVRVDTGMDPARAATQSMDAFLADVHRFLDGGADRLCMDVAPEISEEKVFAFLQATGNL